MKQPSYGERDYVFGQSMPSLRSAIGLTQAGLAELLGVSRKAIGRWETGETYPSASHLKALLALALGQRAFAVGREEEEIRAFWRDGIRRCCEHRASEDDAQLVNKQTDQPEERIYELPHTPMWCREEARPTTSYNHDLSAPQGRS